MQKNKFRVQKLQKLTNTHLLIHNFIGVIHECLQNREEGRRRRGRKGGKRREYVKE
jgi:hypothetical protein